MATILRFPAERIQRPAALPPVIGFADAPDRKERVNRVCLGWWHGELARLLGSRPAEGPASAKWHADVEEAAEGIGRCVRELSES
jgi:hypothetical protein